jgi:hypothetical protein
MRITLTAGAVSSAVAIAAVFTVAFAQSVSNGGSALTRERWRSSAPRPAGRGARAKRT